MKINKSILFIVLVTAWVIICFFSCAFPKDIQVREIVVKVVKIDTVYRYNNYNETTRYAVITVEDERGESYTLNPPKVLPHFDWVGETKIVYIKW